MTPPCSSCTGGPWASSTVWEASKKPCYMQEHCQPYTGLRSRLWPAPHDTRVHHCLGLVLLPHYTGAAPSNQESPIQDSTRMPRAPSSLDSCSSVLKACAHPQPHHAQLLQPMQVPTVHEQAARALTQDTAGNCRHAIEPSQICRARACGQKLRNA